MTAEHNHPPRCCCVWAREADSYEPVTYCPACPEHGELAPTVECPQCHQPIGRPHTESCTLDPDRMWTKGPQVHKPFPDDGVTYCGWSTGDRIVDGCGETWPCSTVRARGEGHHLVHSEAFIDQDDPRGWRNTIDPNKP